MSTQHDAITSLSEFWRTLAIVAVGFGLVLALSWSIDAEFPRERVGASSAAHSDASA
jgi:hypothetical protein